MTTGGQTYFFSAEPDGTVNGVIRKSDRTVVAQYAYTPWGELESAAQAFDSVSTLRWKGLPYDAETGFYAMRARYYDPKIRRFVSEDPIGFEGGINLYQFASGDAVNRSDPSGLAECKWVYYPGAYITTYDVYNGNHSVWTDAPRMDYVCQEQTAHRYDNPAIGGSPANGQTTGGNSTADTPPNTSIGRALGCIGNGTVQNFIATKQGVREMIGLGGQFVASTIFGAGAARAMGVPRIGGVVLRYGGGVIRSAVTGTAVPGLTATVAAWEITYAGGTALAAGAIGSAITAPLVYGALNFGYLAGSAITAAAACLSD